MILKDLHVHTYFCDGKDSPRKMVLAALDMGMKTIGFSGHGYTDFDESYCMSKTGTIEYKREIESLKKEFAGQIEILCGVEKDMFSKEDTSGFDYVIGSAHYIYIGGEYITVDWKPSILRDAADKYFGGDMMALAEYYFATVADVAEKTNCNIVGHLDLITKFNETEKFFDTSDPRYVAAWKKAVDKIMQSCTLFEINTGAMARSYTTKPYPAPDIIAYIKEKGGSFILSSDSHSRDSLCYGFAEYENLLD